MAEFVWDGFGDSVRRSLKAGDWSKQGTQRVACDRDSDLCDACLRELLEYKSHSLFSSTSLVMTHLPAYGVLAGHLEACRLSRPPGSIAKINNKSC
jgi:hypothetical protein